MSVSILLRASPLLGELSSKNQQDKTTTILNGAKFLGKKPRGKKTTFLGFRASHMKQASKGHGSRHLRTPIAPP